ncbi:hypothetical protein Fcan01_02050 [Folsomia candida]|uniref:Uncharacterized protein n=1 Tax=Folsomia candida TaxID=158441 RepID=A0A226F0V0_FOLCA|nr:hypothetical protein Fcan01_02050 [Folsomia candida]
MCMHASSLKCHTCINHLCPESHPFLCESTRQFILERLKDIYYSYGSQVKMCPDPHDADGWGNLAATTTGRCGEESEGEATCSLGRFRVITTIVDSKENVTSYGTSLGCAKRKLLDVAKVATRNNECSLVHGQSVVRNSLRHRIEIEHCFTVSEMCRNGDFCIEAESSAVKKFREDVESEGSSVPLGLIISGVLLLAIVIGVLFLLGIKYDVRH